MLSLPVYFLWPTGPALGESVVLIERLLESGKSPVLSLLVLPDVGVVRDSLKRSE